MNKKFIRILACLTMLVMVFAALGGCGQSSNQTETTTASTTATAAATTEQPKEKTLEEYTDEIAWEVWFLWTSIATNPGETALAKYLKEKFKIDLTTKSQWFSDNTQLVEKLNLAIASDEMPDAFFLSTDGKPIIYKAADAGLLLGLDEAIDKYIPNYKQTYLFPEALASVVNPTDKKIYCIPNMTIPKNGTELGLSINYVEHWQAREDIFKNLGLSYPTNPDELYNVLKTIHEKMPKVNGQPLYPYGNEYGPDASIQAVFGVTKKYYGVTPDHEQKRLITYVEDPGYLEYLKYVSRLYREGLVAKDFLAVKSDEAKQRIRDGRVALYYAHQGEITIDQAEIAKKIPGASITPIAPIKKPGLKDEEMGINRNDPMGQNYLVISKKMQQPERFLKLQEWGASKEGYKYFYYGPDSKEEGCWYYDENNKAVGVEGKVGAAEDWTWIPENRGGFIFNVLCPLIWDASKVLDVIPGGNSAPEIVTKQIELYKNTSHTDPLFSLASKLEAGPIAKDKVASITKVIGDTEPKIIMTAKNDEEVEAMYKQMMEDCNKAGLMEVLKEDYTFKYLKAMEMLGK